LTNIALRQPAAVALAKYRDDLAPYPQQHPIHVIMIGGKRDQKASALYPTIYLKTVTYADLASTAREVRWLIEQLAPGAHVDA
jgi:hypothetical protein